MSGVELRLCSVYFVWKSSVVASAFVVVTVVKCLMSESSQMWIYSYNELTDLVELMWKLMIPSTAYNVVNTANIWTWAGDNLSSRLQQLNSFGQYFINHPVHHALLLPFQHVHENVDRFKYIFNSNFIVDNCNFLRIEHHFHQSTRVYWFDVEGGVSQSKCMRNFFLIP